MERIYYECMNTRGIHHSILEYYMNTASIHQHCTLHTADLELRADGEGDEGLVHEVREGRQARARVREREVRVLREGIYI